MKKLFLLSSMALASLMANAQSVTIGNATVAKGGKGMIEITFEDFDWTESNGFKAQLMPIYEGMVTVGDWNDIKYSEVLYDIADYDASSSGLLELTNKKLSMQLKLNAGAYCKEITDSKLVISMPIVVSEDAEAGVYDIEADEELGFKVGSLNNWDDFEVENGTLTITDGATPLTYVADVYASDGKSSMTFANAAAVKTYLDANVNAIVAFASEAPAGAANYANVVVAGVAKNIVLSNAAAYTYTGTAFTAENVEFTYNFTTKASKAGGWNSLAIPFTGTPDVDPFTTADKENGKFWAKEFVSATESGLEFADLASAQFVANKSYIVAFPGESYGSNEFDGNSIVISAIDATVQPSTSVKAAEATPFTMKTIYAGQAPKDSYVLDPALNKFVKQDAAADVKPFQAYAIASSSAAPALRSLAILDANKGLTSVEAVAANAGVVVYANEGDIVINANESGVASVYNMNGQVVKANVKYNEGETRIAGLAAGAYVVAGQVVVLK